MRLRTLQDWVVRPRLLRVQGVADVVSYGGLVREIHVQPSPAKLAAYRPDARGPGDRAQEGVAERQRRHPRARRRADGDPQRGPVPPPRRHRASCRSPAATARRCWCATSPPSRDGWAPRQGVVSRGTELRHRRGHRAHAPRREPDRRARARARRHRRAQHAACCPTASASCPSTTAPIWSTPRCTPSAATCSRARSLVTLVLFVFLLDLRAALIVGALIPLSLLSAFIYLKARGMSANLLSMGAVDFGIIVDGARGDHREHRAPPLARRGHPGPSPTDCATRIQRAVTDVVRPTMFSLLIIIAAYLPIFLLERVEGRIFAPMANTVVAALVGALLFSLTLVPVLATFCYRKPIRHRVSPVLRGRRPPTSRRCAGRCATRGSCWAAACCALVGAGLVAVAPGLRVPARAERGLALPHLHPAVEHQPDRGAAAGAAHHRHPRPLSGGRRACCRSSAGRRTAPTRR